MTPVMVLNIQYGVLPADKEREFERKEVRRKKEAGEKKERKREEEESYDSCYGTRYPIIWCFA